MDSGKGCSTPVLSCYATLLHSSIGYSIAITTISEADVSTESAEKITNFGANNVFYLDALLLQSA